MPGLRKKTGDVRPPELVYAEHRWAALQAGRDGSVPRHDAHPDVYGLVTDFSRNGRWTMVVALGDYKAGVHYSTGGGVMVVSEVAPVAGAAGRYADVADDVFWGRAAHPLKPVRSGVHDLLATVRETESLARAIRT